MIHKNDKSIVFGGKVIDESQKGFNGCYYNCPVCGHKSIATWCLNCGHKIPDEARHEVDQN